ncbi:hypothetical protein AAFF_G00423570 [Aldrovandia affinis]|uniref:Uncharacterized protein n=1 Tax=Aldrovandia affinis TaxID=143900 RepID=A0AAD7WZX0_9TELE|nr:hypothetical protein AAFF_G00423570 [Aldrovandia affinis]
MTRRPSKPVCFDLPAGSHALALAEYPDALELRAPTADRITGDSRRPVSVCVEEMGPTCPTGHAEVLTAAPRPFPLAVRGPGEGGRTDPTDEPVPREERRTQLSERTSGSDHRHAAFWVQLSRSESC